MPTSPTNIVLDKGLFRGALTRAYLGVPLHLPHPFESEEIMKRQHLIVIGRE